MSESIFEQMATCDFRAPVNVTVTFEDSDEDISLPKDVIKEVINLDSPNACANQEINCSQQKRSSSSIEKNNETVDTHNKILENRSCNVKENDVAIQVILQEIEDSCKTYKSVNDIGTKNNYSVNDIGTKSNYSVNYIGTKNKNSLNYIGNKINISVNDIGTKHNCSVNCIGTKNNDSVNDIGNKNNNSVNDIGTKYKNSVSDIGNKNNNSVKDIGTKNNYSVNYIGTKSSYSVNDTGTKNNYSVNEIGTKNNNSVNDIESKKVKKYLKRAPKSHPRIASKHKRLLNNDNTNINNLQNCVDSLRPSHRTTVIDKTRQSNSIRQSESTRQCDVNRERNYISNLLMTVSEHICMIMDAFYRFTRIQSSTTDQNTVNEAAKTFNQFKNHMFNLSYCTVINIIWPELNNSSFTQNFINDTTRLANEKNPCTHLQIATLFTEMLKWTRGKHKYLLNNTPAQLRTDPITNQNNANSALRQQLMEPPWPSNFAPNPYTVPSNPPVYYPPNINGNTQKSPSCIFSAGPPGRNINISVNPSDFNHQKGANNSKNATINDDSVPEFSNESNILSKSSYVPQQNNTIELPEASTTYSNNSYLVYNNPGVNINNIMIQAQPYVVPYYYQNQSPGPSQHVAPPAYSKAVQNTEPRGQQNQPEPTRSTSTDSGFMSPVNFGTNEPMNNAREEQQSLNTPLITHVTSLNPKVSYNNEEACHICGNLTKHMCLGCFKIYYCSTECQRQDWNKHMVNCNKNLKLAENMIK